LLDLNVAVVVFTMDLSGPAFINALLGNDEDSGGYRALMATGVPSGRGRGKRAVHGLFLSGQGK
jgi:hypothetical protein